MKKLLLLGLTPFILAACGGMGGITGGPGGLQEETLSGTMMAEFAPPPAAAPAGDAAHQNLLFAGPRYVIGSPYRIEDVQYTPAENFNYDETGIAGIMPVDLNGAPTTNGEVVDISAMVGTSKVLPLPSIVRVTNLDNGTSVVLRINNRGPFVNTRLMDVSPAAARRLGMTGQTRVRVQILENESRRVRDLTLAASGEAPAVETHGAATAGAGGPFTVQIGAFHSEDSANSIANRVSRISHATVIFEDGMHKIRMPNLSADEARRAIQRLRSEENMAPGLLRDGRWVNADSI